MNDNHTAGNTSCSRTSLSSARQRGRAFGLAILADAGFQRHAANAMRSLAAAMPVLQACAVQLPPPAREPWQQSHHAQSRKDQAMRAKARRR